MGQLGQLAPGLGTGHRDLASYSSLPSSSPMPAMGIQPLWVAIWSQWEWSQCEHAVCLRLYAIAVLLQVVVTYTFRTWQVRAHLEKCAREVTTHAGIVTAAPHFSTV